MESYLASSKKSVISGQYLQCDKITVVIGNEACDLDSVISALVWANFMWELTAKTHNDAPCIIPVLNIKKSEFRLRTEVKFLLRKTLFSDCDGSFEDVLLFRDELDLNRLSDEQKLRLILTDHNVISTTMAPLKGAVAEIIDHHAVGPDVDPNRDTVEMVGSCSTLIAEKIFAEKPGWLEERRNFCRALYGTILTDTAALKKVPGKATDKDIWIAEKLEEILGIDRANRISTRIKIFEEIDDAKSDVSELSAHEILDKDAKFMDSVGLSSVPVSFEQFFRLKCEASLKIVERSFEKFCSEKKVDALVMLNVFRKDKRDQMKEREVVIFSKNSSLREQIVEILSTSKPDGGGLDLQLEKKTVLDSENTVVFAQRNFYQGRKNIMPALLAELKC